MSTDTGFSGLSLSQLYDQVAQTFQNLEEGFLSSSEESYQDQVKKSLEKINTVKKAIDLLSLFSQNEFIEEMNTSYIKFMMVDYYAGKFTLMINGQESRLEKLEHAKKYLTSFLSLCSDYALASKESVSILKGKPIAKIIVGRDERIAQFKKEKEIQANIQTLNSKIESYGTNSENNDELDSLSRDLYLTLINFYQLKSIEDLNSIQQEQEILKSMPPPDKKLETKDYELDQITWRLDNLSSLGSDTSKLLDSKGKPTRPFVITSRQKELRDQVFRPSWRLPTMTIEEYLDIEMERGNFLQGGGERPQKPDSDLDDDMDALDSATMKQRDWDEFKDNNPRGSGNRGNKG